MFTCLQSSASASKAACGVENATDVSESKVCVVLVFETFRAVVFVSLKYSIHIMECCDVCVNWMHIHSWCIVIETLSAVASVTFLWRNFVSLLVIVADILVRDICIVWQKFRSQTLSIMRQALTLLQIFAISQFGCGGREFQKNLLKRTTKGNHWG